jgi:hypothetical protein
MLGIGSTLLTAALTGVAASAQTQSNTRKAERDQSASDPGPENRPLLKLNSNSNTPPPTDHGDVGPIWYSFDLTHKRIQEGGWTHQVTQRELPSSKDIAGVNTVDVRANDVGYVPAVAGHYIENTGDTDLVALEMFKAPEFVDVSLNNWLRRLPPEMVTAHLGLDAATIRTIPAEKLEFAGAKLS